MEYIASAAVCVCVTLVISHVLFLLVSAFNFFQTSEHTNTHTIGARNVQNQLAVFSIFIILFETKMLHLPNAITNALQPYGECTNKKGNYKTWTSMCSARSSTWLLLCLENWIFFLRIWNKRNVRATGNSHSFLTLQACTPPNSNCNRHWWPSLVCCCIFKLLFLLLAIYFFFFFKLIRFYGVCYLLHD